MNGSADFEWVGIDSSETQIQEARNRFEDANAQFVMGDAEYIPFSSNRFDAVVSLAALPHLPNWDTTALNELTRTMKNDAALLFREPLKYNPFAYTFRRVSPGLCHTSHENPFPHREFQNMLEGAFRNVDIRSHQVFSPLVPFVSGMGGLLLPWTVAKLDTTLNSISYERPSNDLGCT